MHEPLRNQCVIPARAVLLGQQHQIAPLTGARRRARMMETHERGERVCLAGRGGGVLGEKRGEPQRLRAQLLRHERLAFGGGVTAVEQQIDRVQEPRQALTEPGAFRDLERQPESPDLALGAHQALGHGLGGREKTARDPPEQAPGGTPRT